MEENVNYFDFLYEKIQKHLENEKKGLPSVSIIARENPSPYRILASTIISLRTKDSVTLSSSRRLFEKADSFESLLQLDEKEIKDAIYPAAFYTRKAENLKEIAKIVVENYNGKLPDEMELEMEEEMDRGFACVTSAELGKARRLDDASGRYIEFCKASISGNADLKGLKILVDCANGAAYHIAPSVFHELGAEVTAVGNTPDGFNINAGVGATHTEHLPELVREHGCDVAVSLDGDADRLIMADAHHVYNGDELLWAMVTDRLLDGAVSGVAGTLMTNFALEQKLAERQIPFGRAKVGDRYVLEMMKREGWLLGGETSGHIIALDKQTTGDGLVSALQVLAAMRRQEKTLAEVTAELTLLPQVLVNRPIEPGFDWRSSEAFGAAVREAEKTLEGRGRLLVRPSGTEPLLRIMVETADPAEARRLAEELAAALP